MDHFPSPNEFNPELHQNKVDPSDCFEFVLGKDRLKALQDRLQFYALPHREVTVDDLTVNPTSSHYPKEREKRTKRSLTLSELGKRDLPENSPSKKPTLKSCRK